jgi:hypothetical protein
MGVAQMAKKSTLPDEDSLEPKHVIIDLLHVSQLIMQSAVLYKTW